MFGEYIPSNQGTVHDIYGNVQSSAVDGRSPYVTSNYGTVDTLRLQDGQRVRVSAVDGDSPYIVARSNGLDTDDATIAQLTEYKKNLNANFNDILNESCKDNRDREQILLAKNNLLENQEAIYSKKIKKYNYEHDKTKMFLYGSIALNIGIIAYCAMKK